jgi:hypothetical protein
MRISPWNSILRKQGYIKEESLHLKWLSNEICVGVETKETVKQQKEQTKVFQRNIKET